MTIVRVKHNRENPYVLINKAALWNPNLSLKAVGLWAKCLSRPDDWKFHVSELADSSKEGKRAIYSAIDELESERYVLKLKVFEKNINGKFEGGAVEYIFFEFPYSDQERDDCILEFNKSFRLCGFGDRRGGDVQNAPLLSTDSSSLLSTDKKPIYNKTPKPSSAPPQVSAEADSLCTFFFEKIRERNPEFKEPKLSKWILEFDCLLRLDKRDPVNVKKLIEWASNHKWWKTACLSPSKLRKDYDIMVAQMNGDSEKETIRKNRFYAMDLKEKYPEQMKALSFDDKYAINRTKGKEIPFNLPDQTFKKALVEMFGGDYVRRD